MSDQALTLTLTLTQTQVMSDDECNNVKHNHYYHLTCQLATCHPSINTLELELELLQQTAIGNTCHHVY